MTQDFAGVQDTQTLDAPNPDAPQYLDPMQWWFDMTPAQQEQHQAEKLALYRKVLEVCGLSGVASNANWVSPWNPHGMNPMVWNEYKSKTKA